MNKYRIATWNVERPKKNSKKTKLAVNKINEVNADILVLTESSNSINLYHLYESVKSTPFEKTPDEHWVEIWSKWEITERIETFNCNRTACALVNAPFGKIVIYGTIIPYHMAGVSGNRYGNLGYKAWQYHEEDIEKQSNDWKRIKSNYEHDYFFVIGDFNQVRDNLPYGYGTKKCRNLLTKKLEENDLTCLTEIDFSGKRLLKPNPKTKLRRRNIDHIVASNNFISSIKNINIGAWDSFTNEGVFMSDHNGVFIDFEKLQRT